MEPPGGVEIGGLAKVRGVKSRRADLGGRVRCESIHSQRRGQKHKAEEQTAAAKLASYVSDRTLQAASRGFRFTVPFPERCVPERAGNSWEKRGEPRYLRRQRRHSIRATSKKKATPAE